MGDRDGLQLVSGTVIFGYRHVVGLPVCPCRDPGTFMALEQPGPDPLDFVARCWCGATLKGRFDSAAERAEFLTSNGVEP